MKLGSNLESNWNVDPKKLLKKRTTPSLDTTHSGAAARRRLSLSKIVSAIDRLIVPFTFLKKPALFFSFVL
jgi:hypothetical protein